MGSERVCDKSMTFSECELAILRMQVDQAQEKISRRVINSKEIQTMFKIVEDFIKKKSLVCYGGIAINALLPEEDKIYNADVDLPDYDFFSPNALEDVKELSDIYFQHGYSEVEAKSGQHHGTFKVFVNFIGVADISLLPKELYHVVKKNAVRVNGILYTDPNFLRMGMYLELSRPAGDTDRWEKVMKRLALINKYYPLEINQCADIDFQRELVNKDHENMIYETVKNTLIDQGVVFFGGYAISLYGKYMPKQLQRKVQHFPDFDVISHDPKATAQIIKERLKDVGITNTKIEKKNSIGEIIPLHYELKVGDDTIAFIYEPVACHSYNVIMMGHQKVRIATIDTMLSFYLAFLYANKPYYNIERLLCMSKFLFDVQQKNRLEQKGLLKRFSITCFGHQDSKEEMRAYKTKIFEKLKDKKDTKEYEEWFLNYRPSPANLSNKSTQSKKTKQNKVNQNKVKPKKRQLTTTTQKTSKTKRFTSKTLKNKKNSWYKIKM